MASRDGGGAKASAAEQQQRLDESVLAVARRHSAEHGATQDHFTTSQELRAVPLEVLVQSLNRLLRAERLVAVRGGAAGAGGGAPAAAAAAAGAPSSGGPMRYRVPTAADARTRGLGNEERMVLQRVREGGNAGVWTKDLRQRTNLSQPQVARILKALEARGLVKAVKGVAHPSRKLFMLAELEPSREITGGAWYINNEFDEDFIAQLRRVCLKYVGALPRGAAATVGDVAAFVRASGVFGVELQPEDVAVVLDTLYYDNLLDKLTAEEALAEARAHGVALRLEAEEEAAAAERAAGGGKRRRRQQQRQQRRGSAASSSSTSSSDEDDDDEDDAAAAKVHSSGGSSSEIEEEEEDDDDHDRPGKKRGGRAAGAAAAVKGNGKAKGAAAGRPRRPASSSGGGSLSGEDDEHDDSGPSRSETLDTDEDDGGAGGDDDDEDDGGGGDFEASDEEGGGKKRKRRHGGGGGGGKGGSSSHKRGGKKGLGGGGGGSRHASGTPPASAPGAPAARYRLAAHPLPPSSESAALAAPCGACPVAQECREGAQIAPQSCAYFRDWLDF